MDADDLSSIGSLAVALAALVVSLVSMRKTNQFGATTDRLNRLLIDRETAAVHEDKAARFIAEIIPRNSPQFSILRICNAGKGVACNVRLTDLGDRQSTSLIPDTIYRNFPKSLLHPQQSVDLDFFVKLKFGRKIKIRIEWDDAIDKDHAMELEF
ncbi:hypothetical protein EYE42_06230 [Paracoccus subflavus]|uniref:Uncharacterized protein n=1 Tax=Paracoccus subflavus TaxID=2528244 RepID=A0A4Q9G2B4_9RHOB|nr:hypothetical protein [Paracoccus subflavus]TBN41993.1 hypothetical protein EYE42_06230 [Paracoccus subflavus]